MMESVAYIIPAIVLLLIVRVGLALAVIVLKSHNSFYQ